MMTPFEEEFESALTSDELLVELLKWVTEKNRIGFEHCVDKPDPLSDEIVEEIIYTDQIILRIVEDLRKRPLSGRVREFLSRFTKEELLNYATLGWCLEDYPLTG